MRRYGPERQKRPDLYDRDPFATLRHAHEDVEEVQTLAIVTHEGGILSNFKRNANIESSQQNIDSEIRYFSEKVQHFRFYYSPCFP
ncbi:MAG: hypothetical protein V2A74_09080 [bacterium]